MSIYSWSLTASSNATADANINWQENQAPSTVNNSARAVMAAVKSFQLDISGLTLGGSGDAFTLTPDQPLASLTNAIIGFHATRANTGATTLAVSGLTAKPLRFVSGEDLEAGEIIDGAFYLCAYDTANEEWIIVSRQVPTAAQLLTYGVPPPGSILDYAGATAPSGWLLCYGQAISRTTYATLFDAIGTAYGTGDGSTTFNVPDLRGRVVAGQDDMGGTSANRLTGLSGGVDGDTLGGTGGAESHTLTEAQLAAHDHTATADPHTHTDDGHTHDVQVDYSTVGSGGGSRQYWSNLTVDPISQATKSAIALSGTADIQDATVTVTIADAGSGDAHNNVQPTIILNKIIKT